MQTLNAPLQTCQPIKQFSSGEVGRGIRKLNSKESPGYDLINPWLKELQEGCYSHNTNIQCDYLNTILPYTVEIRKNRACCITV